MTNPALKGPADDKQAGQWVWLGLAFSLPLALGLSYAALNAPVQVAALGVSVPQECQAQWQAKWVATDGVKWRGKSVSQAAGVTDAGGAGADFVSSGLLRLQVCGPGTLSFTASGSPAAGQNALLTVALGAKPLLEIPVKQARAFKLRVPGPGWLNIGFPNDFYKPPEDRNLFLNNLVFTPD